MWVFENGNFIEKYETESLSKLFTKIISRYMREINVGNKTKTNKRKCRRISLWPRGENLIFKNYKR